MDLHTLPQLDEAYALNPANKRRAAEPCKICKGRAPFFDVVDFNKCCDLEEPYQFGPANVAVPYFRCEACQFAFTTFFDGWDASLFQHYIYNDMYIHVDPEYAEIRPVNTGRSLAAMLQGFERLRLLDYGSGSGVLTAVLRQAGFRSVAEFDPFSSPERPQGRFDIITCFETIEHAPDPVAFIQDMTSLLAEGGCMIIGTSLQPADFQTLRGAWWYVAPRNGHVSIYSLQSLRRLAERAGLTVRGSRAPLALAAENPRRDIATLLRRFDDPPPAEPPPPPAAETAGTSVKRELATTMQAVNRLALAAKASLVWRTRAAVRRRYGR